MTQTPTPIIDIGTIERIIQDSQRETLLDISTEEMGPGLPGGVYVIWSPAERRYVSIRAEIEANRIHPADKRGTETAHTLEAFIDLFNRHKTPDSVIFATTDAKAPGLTGIIDYHKREGATADNQRQRIVYKFPLSDDWKAWMDTQLKAMSQTDFAEWIEERVADLVSPSDVEAAGNAQLFQTSTATPADMLRISRGLQINVDSTVKEIVTLQSGEAQIAFNEVHKDSDGKPIKIPGMFMVAIPPFVGAAPTRLPARLRYRKSGLTLAWAMILYRPEIVIVDEVRSAIDAVKKGTEAPVFEAEPSTPTR
jgi:uncharacterized protein YfdQ (DUF2303 family)